MLPFNKLPIKFDVEETKRFLESCDLWGEINKRTEGSSPHNQSKDIWARFLNPKVCEDANDWSLAGKSHESEWLKDIPYVKDMCDQLMLHLHGDRLGGVLLTRLEPGKEILPHIDSGWHAEFYDKYYIPIMNEEGAEFFFSDGVISPEEGDVYAFRNDVKHWVKNNSTKNRIAMIVCIKQSKLSKEGLCLGVQQQQ